MTRDDLCRLEDAILGLREALEALTDGAGNTLPQMAEALGCSLARLDGYVADMRWLLGALERVQQRVGAENA